MQLAISNDCFKVAAVKLRQNDRKEKRSQGHFYATDIFCSFIVNPVVILSLLFMKITYEQCLKIMNFLLF